ncbi:MAG: CDP-alcohol phosphatidyltransferase family protein [Mesorhizobium sp.]
MTIPNIITIGRLLLIPAVAWALLSDRQGLALGLFVAAGVSDGVDGYIARHFNQYSRLGAYLDPVADKLLLVTVFVMLGLMGELPLWLVILSVSRDLLIIGAVMLSSVMGHPVDVRPLFVSKANTAVQILLAAVVLSDLALGMDLGQLRWLLVIVSGLLTVASGAAYLVAWLKHMAGHGETDKTD